MAEVNRPSKALVEIINEVAISGAEKTLQEAQEAFGKINVTNQGMPSPEHDLALLRLEEAKAGLATAKGHLKFAVSLAEHQRLGPCGGERAHPLAQTSRHHHRCARRIGAVLRLDR